MCTANESPTALTGSPVAPCNMPEASIATCPCGSRSTAKTSVRRSGDLAADLDPVSMAAIVAAGPVALGG